MKTMKNKIIILENVDEIDSNEFSKWIDEYAHDNYESVVGRFGLLDYDENQYKELFAEIKGADAIALHSSLSNTDQFGKFLEFLLSLDESPKIYISYIKFNHLTWYFNNELKGYAFETRELLKKLIIKNPNKIFEITYSPKGFFSSEDFDFTNFELFIPEGLDYITHTFRKCGGSKPKKSKSKSTSNYKKKLREEMRETLDAWGLGEPNISDIVGLIK